MYTINDVGTHRQVNGKLVALTEDERATLRDKWNAPDERPYSEKRKAEYPSIEECVHAILDDGLVELQKKRAVVKAKYPKAVS
tara:strand:- start:528 stop:776 length:249 start_codon:yes stop_codon:yes gene_type:complete